MKKILILIVTAVFITSCEFSEECNYTGSVELSLDWESLWGNLQKPDSLSVFFYREGTFSAGKGLLGNTTDTLYNNIPSGNSNMVIFNHPQEIESHSLVELSDAELRLPTYFEGNIRPVRECPMICQMSNDILVPIEGTAKQGVSPLPIVKQMVFTVNVIREGITGELTACNASLSGISTGYSFSNNMATRTKSTVFFPLEKKKEIDSFTHSFFVLGVNPDKEGEEDITKKLSITVTLSDGEVKSTDFDLSDQLNSFNSNIFKCEVDVTVTSLSATIAIVGWQQGTWQSIEIQ